MRPTNVLVALMMKGLLNNAALATATHRGFGKMADGMSTRVVACTINRWRVKIDWKVIYNERDPQEWGIAKKGGGGREKKEKTATVCMVLETTVT